MGYAELVGGALGLLTALLLAIGGLTMLAIYGFLIASLLHTVVLFLSGYSLWQRSDTAVVATASTTIT